MNQAVVEVRWWSDPVWLTRPWSCPRCQYARGSTPEAGERCPVCGFHETED